MPKSIAASSDTLSANLQGTDPSWRANVNRYVAFHTADPGVGGTQSTNETAYTGYVRQPIPIGGWSGAGASRSNTSLIQFPQCGVTGSVITHVSIGTLVSGAGQILYSGPLSSPLTVANLIQPQFSPGALVATES